MSKNLVTNVLSGTSLYIINIIVAFIISPIMVRVLGNNDYGLWEMVMGIVGYMGILDLGLGPALLRHVAVSHGQNDKNDLQETISTAMALFLGLGFIAVLLFTIISIYPQTIVSDQSVRVDRLELVLILFAANAALLFPLKLYVGVLMGLQKHHLINSTRSILIIARATLVFLLFKAFPGKGLLTLAVLEIASNAIQFALYAMALRQQKSIPRFSPFRCTKRKMKELFGYGVKSALFMVASRLQYASMPFIIGKAIGIGFIVYFVLPNRLVEYAKGLSLAIGFPLTPYFADMIGKNNEDDLKKGWLITSFTLQIITLAMPLYLFFCGEAFLRLWIGDSYATAGRWALYALLIGLAAEAFAPNARQMLLAKDQHGRIAIVCVLLAICSIPLSYWGAKWSGVAGAALGSSIITITISLITFKLTTSIMGISIINYINKTVTPLIIPLSLLGFTLWLLNKLITPNNYFMLILQILLSGIIYSASIWIFSISKDMREALRSSIMSKFRKQHIC